MLPGGLVDVERDARRADRHLLTRRGGERGVAKREQHVVALIGRSAHVRERPGHDRDRIAGEGEIALGRGGAGRAVKVGVVAARERRGRVDAARDLVVLPVHEREVLAGTVGEVDPIARGVDGDPVGLRPDPDLVLEELREVRDRARLIPRAVHVAQEPAGRHSRAPLAAAEHVQVERLERALVEPEVVVGVDQEEVARHGLARERQLGRVVQRLRRGIETRLVEGAARQQQRERACEEARRS